MNTWGWHLVVDAYDCDLDSMKNKEHVENFARELVKEIDMVAYGEPQVIHFGSGDKEGFTLVQLIETSNICAHFANDRKQIFLDVFSCKEFKEHIVLDVLEKYFKFEGGVATSFMERGGDEKEN
jgi:S-adenosylmethionine/arginine decarboxylase-like enzyme